ncbi:YihY/virulence factor BrkB family protein [Cyanobium sp. CH-040]|uniref:YihY/virulence factor BrkB family protein n=1 Tax=Cyanobium sp. CH-040 TaxID=2823708 RepID=UPI0020CC9A3A|nr:YihY/virulence factor BrkB family protein [Cyanobium sp. CH-040]MCP9927221.1 YihY/virulence factor BrkB family protein [Cyanobium sp. CH-040]
MGWPVQRLRALVRPFWCALLLWNREGCTDLSAAFAYHTLQSLLPILLIALSFIAWFLGRDEVLVDQLLDQLVGIVPASTLELLESSLAGFIRQSAGAGVLGLGVLVFTASNAYLALSRGADRLWWQGATHRFERSWVSALRHQFQLRLKAMALLAVLSLLFVLDQRVSRVSRVPFPAPAALKQWLDSNLPVLQGWQQQVTAGVDVLVSFALSFLAAHLLLWMLPSRPVRWNLLFPGAAFIASALTLLNLLLGRILLALGQRFQAYGVIGGVLVFSLWVWMVGAILYYGQCLSITMGRRQDGVAGQLS